MIDLSAYEKAFAAMPDGITEAEVNAERTAETMIAVKDGCIADGGSFTRERLYVRAARGRTGSAYTEKPDADALEMLLRAADNARFCAAASAEPMNAAGKTEAYLPHAAAGIADMLEFGRAAEAEAKRRGLAVTLCTVCDTARELDTVNSKGLCARSGTGYTQSELSVAKARAGADPSVGSARMSAASLFSLDPMKLAAEAEADAMRYDGGLAQVHIPSGRYDAVLTGRVMRNILMTAWQAFSGDAMRRGASVFRRAGERAASDAFSLINAPSHPLIGQAWPTDSEGTPVKTTNVVERGILVSPLYTLGSGAAAGRPSTGSAGRVARMTGEMPIALTTVPAVIYASSGEGDACALCAQMGTGLLLTYSLDLFHSVNVASGGFSIPCGGVYYRNGAPVGAVSGITVAGDIRTLWGNIERMGADLDFDDFYFKTYCVGSPSALVRGITVAS